MVVDDEPDARGIVRRVLERQGADVRAVASADEALALLGDGTALPDVLVSDISMPGQDGYAMMRRLRSLPAARGGARPGPSEPARAGRTPRQACWNGARGLGGTENLNDRCRDD